MELDINKNITPFDWTEEKSLIKVIGVGGGGCNAVRNMFDEKIFSFVFYIDI